MIRRAARTRASVFYRVTSRRAVVYGGVACMVLGWTLCLVAGGAGFEEANSSVIFFGGALAFMGFFAGISRWVADPAARRVLREHVQEVSAHPQFVTRIEYELAHVKLSDQITNLRLDLRGLIVELRAGKKVGTHDTIARFDTDPEPDR